jgi:hypothetical protein
MKQRVLVALLTVLVFASGFAARVWTESTPALPPPPAPFGSEFAPQASAPRAQAVESKKPVDRAQIISDIEKLQPQIAMFQAKLEQMNAEFERNFVSILREDQCQRFMEAQKKMRAGKTAAQKPATPLSDEDIEREKNTPLYYLYTKVTVTEKLKKLTEANNLDAGQQAQARELLLKYRERFLDLVDSIPPLSYRLSYLATDIQKLAQLKK